MRCEVVAIGTELLLGQTVDTNSSWIGEQLALNGIDSFFQIKVGDNIDRIVEVLKTALSRSDAVICCGGLGPTQDDITREAIAKIMNVRLEKDKEVEKRIAEIFTSRGRSMPQNNLRQALVPKGTYVIKDQPGTAPGLICPMGTKILYAVPGVPYELKQMMESTILPHLVEKSGNKMMIGSRVLRTWGHSESRLAELLSDRIEKLDDSRLATIAFLASGIEGLKVRITAKAKNSFSLKRILDHEENEVRNILGESIFGIDDETLESCVIDILKRNNLTMAIAELTSGGMASSRLSNIDPGGETFLGGIVPSSTVSRIKVLGLEKDSVGTRTAAETLALKVKSLFSADIGLSITGTHDVTGSSTAGDTYLGIADNNQIIVDKVLLPGDRPRIGQFSIISLLNTLRLHLERSKEQNT